MGIPFHEVRLWSSAEITLYMCYYRMAPWGEERADIRTANQTQFIAQVSGAKKTGGGDFKLDDFMPFNEKPVPDEIPSGDPPGLRNVFKGLAAKK